MLGKEAVSQQVNVLLGPGMNMKRSPLCGRNFEYFSEDPYLAGRMAAAYIRGIQSNGISACAKHYAANNQEQDRMMGDSMVRRIATSAASSLTFSTSASASSGVSASQI